MPTLFLRLERVKERFGAEPVITSNDRIGPPGLVTNSNGGSIILVILAPLMWLLFVVYSRVIIEVFLALIRTAQNTRELLDRGTD